MDEADIPEKRYKYLEIVVVVLRCVKDKVTRFLDFRVGAIEEVNLAVGFVGLEDLLKYGSGKNAV